MYLGNDLQVAFPSYRNIDDISGSFNSIATSFQLLINGSAPVPPPLSSNQCLISVNGVIQKPDDTGITGFKLSGGNIVFSSAPAGGATFFGVVLAGADYVNAGTNFPDGTLAAPSITFDQDNDTGYFRSGSGAVSFASNGTAAGSWSSSGITAPALIPTGNTVPTNGVYSPASNTVAISTNGTGRLFVDASGNVGVGESSPIHTFCLRKDSATTTAGSYPTIQIDNQNSSGFSHLTFTNNASEIAGIVVSNSDNSMRFRTNDGSERLRITSAGLVGIGTSVPQALLHLSGTSGNQEIRLSDTTNSATGRIYEANGLSIISETAHPITFQTSATSRMSIDASGNVNIDNGTFYVDAANNRAGIGTTSPASIFQVKVATNQNIAFNQHVGESRITCYNDGVSAASSLGLNGSDLRFQVNDSEKARIDSFGRLGLGTSSPTQLLEINGASNPCVLLKDTTNNVTAYVFADDTVANFGAASNHPTVFRVNNIEVARLDTAGRLGIGTTSATSKFVVSNGGAEGYEISPALGTNDNMLLSINRSGSAYCGNTQNASYHRWLNQDLEKARIDSSGRLLVGTSTSRSNIGGNTAFGSHVQIESAGTDLGTLSLINNFAVGYPAAFTIGATGGSTVGSNSIVNAQEDIGIINFVAADGTNLIRAASITAFVDGTPGASDMPGRLVFSTTADGASSPFERMRIKADGFVNIGTGDTDIIWNQTSVTGITLSEAGVIQGTRDSDTVMLLNRLSNDGALVVFAQAGVQEGSISVSGSTVSYNGAHLSRWSQLPGGAIREEILRGTVLSNLDEMCGWGEEENEQLNRMKVSDVEGDRNVSGVFQAWDDDDDTYTDDFYCAMTGDFIIRIADGVTVQRGDLLISAGDGTAKPQDDDIVRSKTIAKVTSANVTCTYDDGSYCVPCVLMAC